MVLEIKNLNAWFGDNHVLKNINLGVQNKEVLALIGPSGCGKSTFLRCLNRLHEETKTARAEGQILFRGTDINSSQIDPVLLRRNIGMVFQKPVPFPGLSILENAYIGLKLNGLRNKKELQDRAEVALKKAALWNEVQDKLDVPGTSLSGGQQQRLCSTFIGCRARSAVDG
jgi:phosphate transport system ATP-binding protein